MGSFCCLGVSVVVGVLLVNLEMMNRNYVNMYVFMIFIKICVVVILFLIKICLLFIKFSSMMIL